MRREKERYENHCKVMQGGKSEGKKKNPRPLLVRRNRGEIHERDVNWAGRESIPVNWPRIKNEDADKKSFVEEGAALGP